MSQVGLARIESERADSAGLADQDHQSRKMEALGRLAAGVAHDFNNLLTVIGGYSDILLGMEELPASARASAQEIKRAADRAFTMTQHMLRFSRTDSAEPKLVALPSLIEGMVPLLKRQLGIDIALETIIATQVPLVEADPIELERMFVNLAANAGDAMPGGGKLRIEVQSITQDAETVVRIIVRDSGWGMDAGTQAHLFEPFFTTKRPGPVTGFGLATVYGVVKQSHGTIRVASEVGQGTSFTIDFPAVTEPDAQVGEQALQQAEPCATETVLLVENDQFSFSLIQSILLRQGYRVLEAHDGFQALRIGRSYRGQIHAVLTNVTVPGVDGRTLGMAVKFMRPDSVLLYMSDSDHDAFAERSLPAHNATVLRKPIAPTMLTQQLRIALDRAAEAGQAMATAKAAIRESNR
jgi:two-component system cell cycle sensor histidine kinase/response regulator CckA